MVNNKISNAQDKTPASPINDKTTAATADATKKEAAGPSFDSFESPIKRAPETAAFDAEGDAAGGSDLKRKKGGRPPLAGHISPDHPLPLYKGAAKKMKKTHEELAEEAPQSSPTHHGTSAPPPPSPPAPRQETPPPPSPKRRAAGPAVAPPGFSLKCSLDAYEANDKRMMEAAEMLDSTMRVFCQISDLGPLAADNSLVGQAVGVQVPEKATVAFLIRAITRQTENFVWPSMQQLSLPEGNGKGSEELDTSATLQSYGVVDGSTVCLALRATGDTEEMEDVKCNQGAGSSGAALASGEALARAPLHDEDEKKEILKGKKKHKWPREQVEALVAGVEQHGFAWSVIQTEFGNILGERSQVNLKDKWRNLQLAMSRGWSDDRASIPEALKAKIMQLHNWQLPEANAEQEPKP